MRLTIEGTDEIFTSNGGLAVAGALMKQLKIGKSLNKIKISVGEPEISNRDVVCSYLGLLVMGRTNYEDIELFRNDGIFRIMLDVKKVPSAETLRQRFDAAQGAFDVEMMKFNVALLKKCRISMVAVDSGKYIPVDIDVSPFDLSLIHISEPTRPY